MDYSIFLEEEYLLVQRVASKSLPAANKSLQTASKSLPAANTSMFTMNLEEEYRLLERIEAEQKQKRMFPRSKEEKNSLEKERLNLIFRLRRRHSEISMKTLSPLSCRESLESKKCRYCHLQMEEMIDFEIPMGTKVYRIVTKPDVIRIVARWEDGTAELMCAYCNLLQEEMILQLKYEKWIFDMKQPTEFGTVPHHNLMKMPSYQEWVKAYMSLRAGDHSSLNQLQNKVDELRSEWRTHHGRSGEKQMLL